MDKKIRDNIVNIMLFISIAILYVALASSLLMRDGLNAFIGGGYFNLRVLNQLLLIILASGIFIINLYSYSIVRELRYLIFTFATLLLMVLYSMQLLVLVNELFSVTALTVEAIQQLSLLIAIAMLVLLAFELIFTRRNIYLNQRLSLLPMFFLILLALMVLIYTMLNNGYYVVKDIAMAIMFLLIFVNIFGYLIRYLTRGDRASESLIFVGVIHFVTYLYPPVTDDISSYQFLLIGLFRILSLIYMIHGFYKQLFTSYLLEQAEISRERMEYTSNLERLVEERTRDLSNINATLKNEINAAKELQKSMMPPKEMLYNGASFISENIPCDHMSGDFFDIYEIDEDRVGMYILDVSGHGINAALMNMYCYHYIRSSSPLIKRYLGDKPHENLSYLYEQFNKMNFPDDMHLVLMIAALNLRTGEFYYANGGLNTEPLLVRHKGETQKLDQATGFPICKMGEYFKPEYTEAKLILEKGDRILFFTDGLLDERQGFSLMEEDLQEIMLRHIDDPLAHVDAAIRRRIEQSSSVLVDDVSYFILQVDR